MTSFGRHLRARNLSPKTVEIYLGAAGTLQAWLEANTAAEAWADVRKADLLFLAVAAMRRMMSYLVTSENDFFTETLGTLYLDVQPPVLLLAVEVISKPERTDPLDRPAGRLEYGTALSSACNSIAFRVS